MTTALPYSNRQIHSVRFRNFTTGKEEYTCFASQRQALEFARLSAYDVSEHEETSAIVHKGHQRIVEYYKNSETMGCVWQAAGSGAL